jgi:uncharacterized protein (TIGR01244 family)
MNATKIFCTFLLMSFFMQISTSSANDTVHKTEIEGIVNYSRIGSETGFGGTTAPEAMAFLAEEGYSTVINLRQESEEGAYVQAEGMAAEATGINYVHLPFDSSNPAPGYFEQFLAAVEDPSNQPVYIHCGSATRAAALWMSKRVIADGWSLDEAAVEARQIAGKPDAAVEFATKYIESQE